MISNQAYSRRIVGFLDRNGFLDRMSSTPSGVGGGESEHASNNKTFELQLATVELEEREVCR